MRHFSRSNLDAYLLRLSSLLLGFAILAGILTTSAAANEAMIPLAVSDSMQIFYRLSSGGTCQGPISLGDFVKRTLAGEVYDNWPAESLRANAIASRSFTISPYKSTAYLYNGQYYHCTNAWEQYGFGANKDVNQYPNVVAAVDYTNGILMTHPDASAREVSQGWPSSMRFGAIEARYQAETGGYTLGDSQRAWIKEVFDPISSGTPQYGMGQEGSRRWAAGANDVGQAFPKWDYRRILAHYYSSVDFVGISVDPPNDNRTNILEVQGVPPNGGLIMCRKEELTGVVLDSQNVGNSLPVDTSLFTGFCSGITSPQTLVGYHLYRQDGTQACNNCIGLRNTALCGPEGAMPPGRNQISSGFKIFIPDDPAILPDSTYLLRFDLRRNGVWQGRNANFPWPPQDIPVTICTGSGGNVPEVSVNRPPAVVSYADLVNDRYGFSWSGRNATSYDLEYRSKEIGEVSYPGSFTTLLSNSQSQQFSATVGCYEDRRDWQFRLRGRNSSQTGNWVYVESRTQVYPHPWLSYWSIAGLVLNSDPGPWPRPLDVINLGGGVFNWSATDNQNNPNWITEKSSGQGPGSLGVTLSKPGGSGDYSGTITVNITSWTPNHNCGPTTFQIPVSLLIRDTLNYQYLPIIFKNSQ